MRHEEPHNTLSTEDSDIQINQRRWGTGGDNQGRVKTRLAREQNSIVKQKMEPSN